MAFKCGFFNSTNNDRPYTAEQMNMPYKKIVSNGVFGDAESSTDLQVQATTGLNIIVKQGNGIFFDKWCENDSDMPFTISTPHVTQTRIDSVIIKIDNSASVRAGTIELVTGTPDSTPVPPTLINNNYIKEYRLANITVAPNIVTITQASIEDTRPTNECGFITNLLWDSDITATYSQWQTQFDEWFNNLRLTLSTVTAITSFTSRYVATTSGETTIPIQIDRYNSVLDILQVYINGIMLIKDVDYTVTDNTEIELLHAVDTGTPVSFIVYKSVDGTEAETVIDEVNSLFSIAPTNSDGTVKITVNANENVLTKFTSSGIGFKTLKNISGASGVPIANGVFTFFGQMTTLTDGFLIAIQDNNSIFMTYYNNGAFTNWRTIFDSVQAPLYSSGGMIMDENHTIYPAKSLSNCRNGWVLLWSGYENNASVDAQIVTQVIPKLSVGGIAPDNILYYQALPQKITSSQNIAMVGKALYISNGRITGHQSNGVGASLGYVLRAVYEY